MIPERRTLSNNLMLWSFKDEDVYQLTHFYNNIDPQISYFTKQELIDLVTIVQQMLEE